MTICNPRLPRTFFYYLSKTFNLCFNQKAMIVFLRVTTKRIQSRTTFVKLDVLHGVSWLYDSSLMGWFQPGIQIWQLELMTLTHNTSAHSIFMCFLAKRLDARIFHFSRKELQSAGYTCRHLFIWLLSFYSGKSWS